ncbi:MAG: ABC transporter ATP-binding protein [Oscillospiraceae bacterium]|nr:ABC transporter ATP-binding protein [Oscillospiraceae bacterium]
MDIIQVQDLTKTYGDLVAVDHISFQVEKGTMLGFLGVNGAGKSTAINMLSTLLRPDAGTARICGSELGKEDHQIRSQIGIVYQQNVLDDLLSVKENLLCRGILHGATKAGAQARLVRLSQILKLEDLLKKRYKLLSGGQKRRCEIAAALMHTPKVLFLDEPTTGLDPATRKDVWSIIDGLRQEEDMTVFLTTHYMEEAAQADKIIILDKGKIITSGTPFDLKERYAKDKLRLYCDAPLDLPGTPTPYGMELSLDGTMEALEILETVKHRISGFEVIQGSMDDVFLNAVGKALED